MEISDTVMDAIIVLMNDDIREQVHVKYAPCSNKKFLKEYCKLDPAFTTVLLKFGILILL